MRSSDCPDEIRRALHAAIDSGHFVVHVDTDYSDNDFMHHVRIRVEQLSLAMRYDASLLQKEIVATVAMHAEAECRAKESFMRKLKEPPVEKPNYNQMLSHIAKELTDEQPS